MSVRLSALAIVMCVGAGCHPVQPSKVLPVPATNIGSPPPPPRSQNPSPMTEHARKHERIPQGQPPGVAFTIDSVFAKPVEVFIPEKPALAAGVTDERTLLVHLFSASYVPMHAVSSATGRYVLAVVNLGSGSAAYERPLSDTAAWNTLIRRVRAEAGTRTNGRIHINRVIVSAFSAGYGGVRALLNDNRATTIDGIILLDGLHTSYIPERQVVAEGGVIDTTKLVPFLNYAKRAVAGETRMLITHSEIFPGTFASTTETTDWLIAALGLTRTPVLAWGPGGMQQLSEVRKGQLTILGFAGNAGPDHIDQLHGLGEFLERMER
jgi:hypothetical protein